MKLIVITTPTFFEGEAARRSVLNTSTGSPYTIIT